MRKIIIDLIVLGIIDVLLYNAGILFNNWYYWGVMFSLVVITINNKYD